MATERLPNIPGVSELQMAYSKFLSWNCVLVNLNELSVFSQWCRFDPRLAEIWVAFLAKEWENLNPVELRKALLNQRWPAAAAVLLEFSEKMIATQATDPSSVQLFSLWRRIVTEGFRKGNWEQFFIGLRGLGGKAMQEDALFAFSEYRKWGYLGREILMNKGGTRHMATHSVLPETRQEILKAMLSASSRITTDLYWNGINRCISRRQAERDLKGSRLLKARGNTKGRYFLKRS